MSINHKAIFIRIAEIIGNGKNLKNQLNNNADIINVRVAVIKADAL